MPRDVFRLAFQTSMSADSDDTGELKLYGEIVQDYGKWYKENYPEDKSANDFDKAIKELKDKGVKKLNMRINSPGGIVTEAVAMRSILSGAGFDEVNIRIEGMCASAATLIASIPGAKVFITKGSEYMIHNPWTFAWGNANDMEHVIDHLRQLEDTCRAFYAQRSGQSDEQIKEWMDAETWFTAEKAVEYGFADELAKDEVGGTALPAAACVTSREMAVMKGLYKSVPEEIEEKSETFEKGGLAGRSLFFFGDNAQELILPPHVTNIVRHGVPDTGEPSEHILPKEESTMEIKDITMEQLRDENPALYEQVRQDAVAAERSRLEEIDALTMPGYEEMASEAKANGTSAMDFQKQIVAAMKKKGKAFIEARQQETAPAQDVTGEAPADDKKTEEQALQEAAKAVADFAATYSANTADGMF